MLGSRNALALPVVARRHFALLAAVLLAAVPAPAAAQVVAASQLGTAWDWLVGSDPFYAEAGATEFSPVSATGDASFSGPVRLGVSCCKDPLTGAPLTAPGLTIDVKPEPCREPVFTPASEPRPAIPPRPPQIGPALPLCPAAPEVTVAVAPGQPAAAVLRLRAATGAAPVTVVATLVADWAGGRATRDVYASVAPAPWPGDGPAPACASGVTLVPLAAIRPPPPQGKRAIMPSAVYSLGVGFPAGSPASGVGMQIDFSAASTTGPLPPGVTTVTLANSAGWPIGMRTVNSRNCGAPARQVIVPAGGIGALSFSADTTTSLVFMKSTCRAALDVLNCWFGSALGMDDLVVLTEGPFWTLFGGRRATIQSVGDWGALPRPDSIAVIRTN